MRRIGQVAARIKKPLIVLSQEKVEVYELKTFIGKKANECWVAYALNKKKGNVIDFVFGKRTKSTLSDKFWKHGLAPEEITLYPP